jgi:argininosuccinate lyase
MHDSRTLWAGRYEAAAADTLRKLNDSLPFDQRMALEDIEGSIVWARALEQAAVLTAADTQQITDSLTAVRGEFERGEFQFAHGDEDIHTAVERRLTEIIGAVAGKLHTGRSRNDQVATDVRLWLKNRLPDVIGLVDGLSEALIGQAEAHIETIMPGYTHLRAAQPITVAHWLLSYVEMLRRDAHRLDLVLDETLSECPLGSSALAGTPFAVDRAWIAAQLGFRQPSQNSLDSISNRDYVVDFLSAASLLMMHLSRFAEDVIIYSTPQFDYIRLDERYTTGSSIMPQKQNPDILELARGKSGRVIGHLSGLLTMLKGLPSTYNKDLQEDKEPLFDTVDTLLTLLPALIGLVQTMQFNPDKMLAGLDEGMLATDAADYLVRRGVPFREAHGIIGRLVRRSLDTNTPLSKLPIEDYRAVSEKFDTDIYSVYDYGASVAQRKQVGGTAPAQIREQLARLKQGRQDT